MFDATALKAIQDELNEKILHGRVQEIVQLDALAFGFEVYANHARHYLYMNVHVDDARVHLVSQKLRASGELPSPMLLLLRKHVEGAFIDSIVPIPNERVLKIGFDHSIEGISTLVVETIGKYSNIILVDASGMVIDALKRVPASINRLRVTLPNHLYAPPPPQAKLPLSSLSLDDLSRVLNENPNAPLWQTLVKSIAGVSPLLAREIEQRANVTLAPHASAGVARSKATKQSLNAREIMEIIRELTEKPFHPCVAFEEGETAAFAPYLLTQFADVRPFDSISVAIETFYGAVESYAAAKEPLRVTIGDARNKLARKRDQLAQALPDTTEVERLKTSGEMILAYASQVRAGQKMLKAEIGEGSLEIALNPQLSVVENAQKYFKEYHNAKDALERVPALLASANADLEYAEQMLNDLELAENRADLDTVTQAAHEAGLIQHTRKRGASKNPSDLSDPRVFTSKDGFTILVGKNARQNDEITFHRANADDVWLHAQNVAGAHVVIVHAGREIPEATVQEAAKLAAQYSQARGESRVDVIVTPRKNVRRVRGGKPGMVTVKTSAIVRVEQ